MDGVTYTAVRSVKDTRCHVLFVCNAFEDLPRHVRIRGPWHVLHRGPVLELLAPYRLTVMRQAYCVIEEKLPQYRILPVERAQAWRRWHGTP